MMMFTSSFTADATGEQVAEGIDLTGRRAIVTGASSGIGTETARVLAKRGAEVTLAVRKVDLGEELAGAIRTATGNRRVTVEELELADLESVRAFVDRWDGPLHLLVNNAGVAALPERTLSAKGWEMQLATNHLGHFVLATGLHPALAAEGARVVVVGSSSHVVSPVVFDDMHFDFRPYDPVLAYAQSKTANMLFTVGAAERWSADGITVNCLMPGVIRTQLNRHIPEYVAKTEAEGHTFRTPEEGSATTILLATAPGLAEVSGRYFEDCQESPVVDRNTGGFGGHQAHGVARYAVDRDNAERLWSLSVAAAA